MGLISRVSSRTYRYRDKQSLNPNKMATLYTWAGNSNAAAVQATAALAGANIKVADFVPGTAPAGFPACANAPVFTTADGKNLTQLSAILAAVNGKSCPVTLEWIGFAENNITPAAAAWAFPTLGAMPNNKGAIAEGKKNLLACLDHLNSYLASRTFLVGDRASCADAAVVASLSLAFKQVLAPEYRKNCPHVVRWFQTCVHKMPAFGKEKGDIDIQGVWFWKGQGLAFEMCEDWNTDYDCYTWEKLDSDNAEHRLKVQEYFAWEGKFDGKSFY